MPINSMKQEPKFQKKICKGDVAWTSKKRVLGWIANTLILTNLVDAKIPSSNGSITTNPVHNILPKVGAPSRHPAQHRPVPNRGRGAFWPPPGDFTGKPRPPLPIIGSTCCDVGLGHTTGHLSTLANTLPGYHPPTFMELCPLCLPALAWGGGSGAHMISYTCGNPRSYPTSHAVLSHGTTPAVIVTRDNSNSLQSYCTYTCLYHT